VVKVEAPEMADFDPLLANEDPESNFGVDSYEYSESVTGHKECVKVLENLIQIDKAKKEKKNSEAKKVKKKDEAGCICEIDIS